MNEFKSLEELYLRIKPALHTKKEEMRRAGYEYVNRRYLELFKRIDLAKSKQFIIVSNGK